MPQAWIQILHAERIAALIAWTLVVRVDGFVKGLDRRRRRRFAPPLTKPSTRTQCCPCDQGRFLGAFRFFQRAIRPLSSIIGHPNVRTITATGLRALTTTMARARRHTGRSSLLSPA